ncbi:hypothetical protein [Acutalibacter sp. 1XD8-36]|uniref:hypothetical protein n=1 Tax=Acutalibacter sp. 1XD8-36 TaxID=2320852 RepID=UPI002613B0E0|nr:hypothetical protein [Acutalibacter sp. 1XD8-36]
MGDTNIKYNEKFGINTFKREICAELGGGFWDRLTDGLSLPDIDTEAACKCCRMRAFMERFENMAEPGAVKDVLCRVRHGLHPSQSAWAREKFLEAGDLDTFLQSHLESELANFEELNRSGRDFYGQYITDGVLAFIREHPSMLAPVRKGNVLHVMAFPADMTKYLEASDPRKKRYYACHCPFAKESILSGAPVSHSLCSCSLGHVMNFIEAFLDRPLTGRVVSSVLAGGMTCEYEINIPEDIMKKYVKA